MATKTKDQPMCPRLTAEEMLDLRSLQLADANLTNSINELTQAREKVRNGFTFKADQIAAAYKVDRERVEFVRESLKFQLKPGVKGKR